MLVIGRSYWFDSIQVGITEGRTKFADDTTEKSDEKSDGAEAGTDAVNADAETAGTNETAYRAGNSAGTKTRGDIGGLEKLKRNS